MTTPTNFSLLAAQAQVTLTSKKAPNSTEFRAQKLAFMEAYRWPGRPCKQRLGHSPTWCHSPPRLHPQSLGRSDPGDHLRRGASTLAISRRHRPQKPSFWSCALLFQTYFPQPGQYAYSSCGSDTIWLPQTRQQPWPTRTLPRCHRHRARLVRQMDTIMKVRFMPPPFVVEVSQSIANC